jgi:hypothetical protein
MAVCFLNCSQTHPLRPDVDRNQGLILGASYGLAGAQHTRLSLGQGSCSSAFSDPLFNQRHCYATALSQVLCNVQNLSIQEIKSCARNTASL